ncbi:hypothetical protein WDW89_16845 [Deltaproteobacteria bacterium TL4]
MVDPDQRVIYANLLDTLGTGKPNMVSFLDDKGSIGLAVDSNGDGLADHIYVFQDVTRDGKLDSDDELYIREKANELMSTPIREKNPILIYV